MKGPDLDDIALIGMVIGFVIGFAVAVAVIRGAHPEIFIPAMR